MTNLSCINGYPILKNSYLFKVNNRNTRTWFEISLKLTIRTQGSSVSVVKQVIIDGVISFKQFGLYVWWRSVLFNIVKNWNRTTFKSCKVGLSAFGWFLVIPPSSGWFWAISDYFMIYTIYIIYFSNYIRTI